MGRPAILSPLSASWVSQSRFELGGGDLILGEALFRGNLLTIGFSAVAKRPRGGPCSASAACGGVLLDAAGAHGPWDLPSAGPPGFETSAGF